MQRTLAILRAILAFFSGLSAAAGEACLFFCLTPSPLLEMVDESIQLGPG